MPGLFQELSVGEDVKFSTPPDTSDGYKDFMKQQLASRCPLRSADRRLLGSLMKRLTVQT
jgi:hypothetical protein